jgi:hypothetical protein
MLLGRLAYCLSEFIRSPLTSAELILIGVGYGTGTLKINGFQ